MIYKLMLILTVVFTTTAGFFLPPTEPAKPKDCPEKFTYTYSRTYSICLTKDKYAVTDRASAQAYCKSIGSSLCSLNNMVDAWRKNYLDTRWGMYNKAGRDARVTPCGDHAGAECHYRVTVVVFPVDIIPNTPRPSAMQPAYCCS